MTTDLRNTEVLTKALAAIKPRQRASGWLKGLTGFLAYVKNSDVETRKTKEFHQRIWEDSNVSGVGMGTVDIGAAIDDAGFREWLAEESFKPLGDTPELRLAKLQTLYGEIVSRLKKFSSRTPRVKIFRVLAALYPQYFTTITNIEMALALHRALFGHMKAPHAVRRQLDISARIEEVLGSCDSSPAGLADRMTIAWFLYEDHLQDQAATIVVKSPEPSGELILKPLPAAQRRKGFTAVKGGLAAIQNALSFAAEGVTRDDMLDYLRVEFPDYRESSIRTLVSILKNEFAVIQEVNGLFIPTDRGELYLETGDPQELIPRFITRILAVDHMLLALSDGPRSGADLIVLAKRINPGWTSDYTPGVMLKWLRDFDLLQVDGTGQYSLTESGKSWASSIHWQPEFLIDPGSLDEVAPTLPIPGLDLGGIDQGALLAAVIKDTAFPRHQAQRLHLGLWSHPRRHFAILAGLSGSGKTLLAKSYAIALAGQYCKSPEKNLFIQAVQPGWYDPAPLFGYINPLQPDNYVRSPLLDFLLRAAGQPDQPFTVILDEMNLSHPEQYFAPVLSAMETGDRLRLHNEGDAFDGVPATIAYPANVAFIGTVNMDETTHGISDKVLDRAFTLEFWDVDLNQYPKWQSFGLDNGQLQIVRGCLETLLAALAPERLHFGWRTVEDVLGYLGMASKSPDFDLNAALDDVVYAKVLPKLRGSESLRLHAAIDKTLSVLKDFGLTRSHGKVQSLKADLADTGLMRFWR